MLVLLLSAVPALGSGATVDTALSGGAASETDGPATRVCNVKLVTGDTVTVAIYGDGRRSYAISPADPNRLGQHFLTIEENGATYIFPDGIDLNKLDRELFNINYLVDEQYYEQPSLPLILSYLPRLAEPQVRSLEGRVRAVGQETRRHSEVFAISTRLPYGEISNSYRNLMSQPEVAKVWLDRKVHVRLANSVPLIGAETWWAAGYNGTGTKIAILDTGIDSSHPDLNDLDDNPATNDPKVVANINFTEDPDFADGHGHGTHVAGIAAGTGSMPGFWNFFGIQQLTVNPATDGDGAWSPQGDKIAFTSNRDGSYDIFMYNLATANISKLLTLSSDEKNPAWSRDGTWLAFDRSNKEVAAEQGIWVVSANGTGLRQVYPAGALPTWRPDGTEIAFFYNDDICAISLNGTGLRQITALAARDWFPAWSPDGSKIAFTSNRTGTWGVWVVDASGTELNPVRIADSTEYGEPAWSANGAWLAFEAPPPSFSSYTRIIAANMDGTSPFPRMVVISPSYPVADPTWSPDGTRLAFTQWDGGDANIWVASKPAHGIRGVAPGARLWNVKVLTKGGWGYSSWIINGINFASLGADGVAGSGDEADIISMSLGGGLGSDGTDPLSQAVNRAVDRGVVVVVAAGNSGPGIFTITNPGVAAKAITVGASTKTDTLADFSSRGPTVDMRIKPDIVAPGVAIVSTCGPQITGEPTYVQGSGTSMATPHVAGAAALLRQYHGSRATPQFIKDALMYTAKDLGYSIYEQGGGRLELTGATQAVVGVTPASLSLGLLGSGNTTASGSLTFSNSDNVSHQVTLSANLTDVIHGGDYSRNVTLTPGAFTIPAAGNVVVSLSVNLTALPASLYSGKIMATVDGGVSRAIHAIFGFAKLWQLNVTKIDINGNPAQGHPAWLLRQTPYAGVSSSKETDEQGKMTLYVIDGTLHIVSPNWKHEQDQVTVWSVAENITVSGDVAITLDERQTRIIDFNPNKAGQIPSAKASILRHKDQGYAWGISWWYPKSFVYRSSPVARFATSFWYNGYPEEDFLKYGAGLVNAAEWYNLLYSADNITDNITFVADYPKLVHRNTGYGVGLTAERAYWHQCTWDELSWYSFAFSYRMDAPRQRSEWLSPEPVRYHQHYYRYLSDSENRWAFHNWWLTYPPGEYSYGTGTHPLISGVDVGFCWNCPPVIPPPPVPAAKSARAGEINRLYVWGPISRDADNNEFYNEAKSPVGHIRIIKDGQAVLEGDIGDSFSRVVSFEGTANFTVEIKAETPLKLSSGSYTRLDFVADRTRDSRPPHVRFTVPGISLSGVVPAGETKVMVQASDDSLMHNVRLSYSLGDSENWTDAGLPAFADGWYIFNLGPLGETFVSLAVDATDQYGNHIHRNTQRAFYVGKPTVRVSVNAPSRLIPGGNFTATVDINQVERFDACNYDVSFNATVLRLVNVTAGQVGTAGGYAVIPVDEWNEREPGRFTIVQNVPGTLGISGSGYLAVLHFQTIGAFGQSTAINLSNGVLSNYQAKRILAAWIADSTSVTGIPGDANEDGNIDALDITKIERIIAGQDRPTPGADANQDSNINAVDITRVERMIAGLT